MNSGSEPSLGEIDVVWVWNLPLARYTMGSTLDRIDSLIAAGRPSFFITANLHYAMLTEEIPALQRINQQAAFILADGMPMVLASRREAKPLPERVAGSDLIYRIAERSAKQGYRLYFLGGPPGIGEQAAERLRERYPGLQVVGVESPPFRILTAAEQREQIERIRSAQPHLLFVAFGQPKGEFWIAEHLEDLGVPLSVQVGATLDFVAGRISRAPRWMQKLSLEWFYRMMQEPRRLLPRYFKNGLFLLRMLFGKLGRKSRSRNRI